MDEEIKIIDEKTRNEKIKSFFLNNKKLFLSSILTIIILIFSFYTFQIYKDDKKEQISNKYNNSVIEYKTKDKTKTVLSMKEIIEKKDSTYSPLALYFIIDNNLIENKNEINELFDILINKTSLDTEIKNLIIYKKGLYNSGTKEENELLEILNPLINSNSIWKSHALHLIAEYFYSKNEKQKSKEFFNQILSTQNANQDIINEAQKRLNRDLSE
jgi:predicted negative regulator of RcsB-dependent stress response|tara:strand:- start:14 stop:658 length:645 start_codon:yes stop_codon:yes gene_type:complete